MNSHRFRWFIIMAAALFSAAASAQTPCAATPEKYRNLEFGDARFAVEEECRQTFTQDEQFFLAGIAQHLRSTCKLPRDPERVALLEQFSKAATLSLELQKGGVPSHPSRASAFAAGASMMEDIRCDGPEAALLARGIAIYLKRTSARSRFVAGCLEIYASRYSEKECRCIADAVQPVFPDVDRRFFDRALIKEAIHDSPRTALTLMLSCGVADY
jgi:hypothetical protein